MHLATLRTDRPDGRLVIVAGDHASCVAAPGIAATVQQALDTWGEAAPALARLAARLEAGEAGDAVAFHAQDMAAPLPRAWQWLDASAFPSHGELMQRAYDLPPIETPLPLMYQGMSHRFLGPCEDVRFPDEADGIDFEGEFGIVTDAVPMGVSAEAALSHVRLIVQLNDWSLRALAVAEMKTGFGWVQAKPACSMAPIAVTPDELGPAWRDGCIEGHLRVELNGERFGEVPANGMAFGFGELIAHAARTRDLCAGTIIGSGTISTPGYAGAGSCCIAERRAIEMIEHGAARTSYLRFGDRVGMIGIVGEHRAAPFGNMHQQIVKQ